MSLLLKILHSQENLSARHKTRRVEQEALRRNEDPNVYHVKQKLRNHPDPKYSSMSDRELTREAIHLSQADSLKEFFSDLTHKPIQSIMEEVSQETSQELTQSALSEVQVPKKHLERASQLTLKLHLNHLDETPSFLTRLGAALLKIPYGVLHATLEIGDTSNPNISYMLEFNDSHLVQPRKKNLFENSALEATIPLGGARIKKLAAWPQPPTSAELQLKKERASVKTGVEMVDEYFSSKVIPIRSRSVCVQSRYKRPAHSNHRRNSDPISVMSNRGFKESCSLSQPILNLGQNAQDSSGDSTTQRVTSAFTKHSTASQALHDKEQVPGIKITEHHQIDVQSHNNLASASTCGFELPVSSPPLSSPVATSHLTSPHGDSITSSEDLTHLLKLSLSKIMLIEKLVQIIIQYNTNYYYHSITRNCQTFIVDVLKSFGVWENFQLGEKLEVYLKNLTKGKKEVYKSHKSVNDRVKYLIHSGEIEETTYDELRYLRSLYTIFHLEESSSASQSCASETSVCNESDCLLHVLEERLKKKRPEDATVLQPPEYYL